MVEFAKATDRQPELLRLGAAGVVPVQWEASKSDAAAGTLTGWAAVYNVVDQQDDVLEHGALRKTLSHWRDSKRVIGLTLDHENTAEGLIGALADASDHAYGLRSTFRFSSTAKAQDARTKAREGILNGLSIFGPIFDKDFQQVAGKTVRVLKEVGLWFVGLTPVPANDNARVLAAKAVSTTPWSQFTQADYNDEQWRRACILDMGDGNTTVKQRFKLPIKEPSGVVNRNGAHAAASALAGGRGGVDAPADRKAAAARALVRIYRSDLDEDPPASLLRLAGMAASTLTLPDGWVTDMRAALAITVPSARDAAVDMLVKAQYGATLDAPAGESDGSSTGADEPAPTDETEDAHKYALSIIANDGQDMVVPDGDAPYALSIISDNGPGEGPPDGEPNDSLAGLLNESVDVTDTKSELDGLEAELRESESS